MKNNIIAFEADHNGGKGTQIQLLEEYCLKNNIPTITTRGALYREGKGTHNGDPLSNFWKQRMLEYPNVDNMTPKEKYGFEKENALRLRRELNIGINHKLAKLNNTQQQKLLLILDRTEISGYFRLKKNNPDLTFEEYLNFKTNKNQITEIIKPDLIFALQVSKKELLNRNKERGEVISSRNQERKNTIIQYHDLFNSVLQEGEKYFPVHYLNGEKSIEEIHQTIIKTLKEKQLI